ncbi:hypothetical protein predicted by Glimmer/Critica [Lactiplantibacillus plantarum]|nr:hypothetical protein predicted by Glimmer/Critica [Lactiplantibacillus plantarum]
MIVLHQGCGGLDGVLIVNWLNEHEVQVGAQFMGN